MPKDRDAQALSEDAAPVRFDSPRSIRALAHPARLAIINALATGEELTATQCAELTKLSPSATAYHLNLLERYGFAEPAPQRSDRRERPWRTTGRRTQVDLNSSTPAGASAASAVVAAYFDTTRALGLEFTAGEYAEPEEWRNAVTQQRRPLADRRGSRAGLTRTRSGARAASAAGFTRRAPSGQQAGEGNERCRPAPTDPSATGSTRTLTVAGHTGSRSRPPGECSHGAPTALVRRSRRRADRHMSSATIPIARTTTVSPMCPRPVAASFGALSTSYWPSVLEPLVGY